MNNISPFVLFFAFNLLYFKYNGFTMPRKRTRDEFIAEAKKIHGDKYDYSKVEYIDSQTKVCIICPQHGEFLVRPNDHIHSKVGCKFCSDCYQHTKDEFVKRAKQIHGGKYDYSNVEYFNNKTKVCIICPIHGEFWQKPNDHLNGNGCPLCSHRNYRYKTDEWIEKAKKVHGNKYDYSKVEYKDANTKVRIICPQHGEFWQKPENHLNGDNCPKCARIFTKSKMSRTILNLLLESGIDVEEEKTFEWLRNKRKLHLDFFLPKYNVAIEVQGDQHFKPIPRFGGEKGLNERKICDDKKLVLCVEHGIKVFYVTKKNFNIDEVLTYIDETAS